MDPEKFFVVPGGVAEAFRTHDGPAQRAAWEARLREHPRRAEFESYLARDGEQAIAVTKWPAFEPGSKMATRKSNEMVLKAITTAAPWLVGGSADLTGSNGTNIKAKPFTRESFEKSAQFHFGVREHGMAAIANGMAVHGGVRPFVATFLIFHDYHRPSVRLASLMKQPVVFVYSHDSVFLGEDGPTHQPIETLTALRAIPGMTTFRPGDAHEVAACWKAILRYGGPTAIVTTRQNLPTLAEAAGRDAEVARGAYVLADADRQPDVVLIATGSEVSLAMDARKLLAAQNIAARVVSMPSVERFLAQDADYRRAVLPAAVPRVSIEAAGTYGWERIVGDHGLSIGIDTFGHSAPLAAIAEHLGFTPPAVATRVATFLGR